MTSITNTICRALRVTLVVGVSSAFAVSADAGQPQSLGGSGNVFRAQPNVRSNPYGRLFEPTEPRRTSPAASKPSGETAKPKAVCGMTMVPADPNIDPGIALKPRPDDTTRYTIRSITPPVCK